MLLLFCVSTATDCDLFTHSLAHFSPHNLNESSFMLSITAWWMHHVQHAVGAAALWWQYKQHSYPLAYSLKVFISHYQLEKRQDIQWNSTHCSIMIHQNISIIVNQQIRQKIFFVNWDQRRRCNVLTERQMQRKRRSRETRLLFESVTRILDQHTKTAAWGFVGWSVAQDQRVWIIG